MLWKVIKPEEPSITLFTVKTIATWYNLKWVREIFRLQKCRRKEKGTERISFYISLFFFTLQRIWTTLKKDIQLYNQMRRNRSKKLLTFSYVMKILWTSTWNELLGQLWVSSSEIFNKTFNCVCKNINRTELYFHSIYVREVLWAIWLLRTQHALSSYFVTFH